jgi:hypothetical protein
MAADPLDQTSRLDRDPFLVAFFDAAAAAYYEMLEAEHRLSGDDDGYQPPAATGRELPIRESHRASAFSASHRR